MFCPCGFPNPQGNNCGSVTRADCKSASFLTRGLQIPEDKGNPQHRNMAIFLSLWICNPQGNNYGSVTRAD